jgi:hypothetical protein
MTLVRLSSAKGAAVWVNAQHVLYVGPPEGGTSDMYGGNNVRSGAKIYFAQGTTLDVRETPEEAAAHLGGEAAGPPSGS